MQEEGKNRNEKTNKELKKPERQAEKHLHNIRYDIHSDVLEILSTQEYAPRPIRAEGAAVEGGSVCMDIRQSYTRVRELSCLVPSRP